MALRNQPYLPLYVNDYLTDEKLNECSAAAQGVYIKLLCIMHKSEPYGTILLKQKYKQSSNICLNFASQLARNLLFPVAEIEGALEELRDNNVVQIEGDVLSQKRMIKQNDLSEKRKIAGAKGGNALVLLRQKRAFAQANSQANTENEIENETEDETRSEIEIEEEEEEAMTAWNLFAKEHGLAEIKKLSPRRRSAIHARFAEKEFDFVAILNGIRGSPFLLGDNKNDWRVDFDFIFLSSNNYLKILEGKYKNGKREHAPNAATAARLYEKHFGGAGSGQ